MTQAHLTMARKLTADFSTRVRARRLSFSQPMSRLNPLAVRRAVKTEGSHPAILARFARDHWIDAAFGEPGVDPVGAIRFVARELCRICQRLFRLVVPVDALQERCEFLRLVGLPRRKPHAERVSLAVADDVEFRLPASARAA